MAKQEDNIIGWITVNGAHVPVKEGQTKADAAKQAIDSKEKQIAANKKQGEEQNKKEAQKDADKSKKGEHTKIENTINNLKFTKSGSTLQDMRNMEKLGDVVESAKDGTRFILDSRYGGYEYIKQGDTFHASPFGLYAEGDRQHNVGISDFEGKVANHLANGHKVIVKRS